ncbi:hypothetical protein ACHAXA_011642 [Cyclostephanos tholiformis]|uniref:Uncharacterized protein n=1 Tax=Cyclostephanos tholiformis TaxID=382380 RepID=A0ABD3SEQ5_9STRA
MSPPASTRSSTRLMKKKDGGDNAGQPALSQVRAVQKTRSARGKEVPPDIPPEIVVARPSRGIAETEIPMEQRKSPPELLARNSSTSSTSDNDITKPDDGVYEDQEDDDDDFVDIEVDSEDEKGADATTTTLDEDDGGGNASSALVVPSPLSSSASRRKTMTATARRHQHGITSSTTVEGRMPSSSRNAVVTIVASASSSSASSSEVEGGRECNDGNVRRRRPLLDEAFSNLDDGERYETVLVGLCAKIVDDGSETNARIGIIDPMRLLGEMNSMGISLGPRGVMGLIDATAQSSDARIMADVLSLARRNGAITRYGSLQGDVDPVPRSPSSPSSYLAYGGGGDRERNARRLASLPPVPIDDRASEVSQAVIFGSTIVTCVTINVLGGPLHLEDITPLTNLVIGIAMSVLVVDNFFDAIASSMSLLVRINEDKLPDALRSGGIANPPTIKKEDMPLGIGTGVVTGSVMRGFGRLLMDDTERDCMCEAASVYVAYVLGLPCFAFRPNAREGADMVLRSMMTDDNDDRENGGGGGYDGSRRRGGVGGGGGRKMDSLASDAGLLKVLIWLMAPVAMELSKYPQLTSSEPREAYGFLERLAAAERSTTSSTSPLADALPADDRERDAYLRWALAEADTLLRRNAKAVDALSVALAGGAATVGDCVAILEGW